MHLYLIRHAEALADREDARRPLSSSGLRDAARLAELLARAGLARPAEVFHSTRLRTRQTAECLARAWTGVPIRERPGLEPHDDVQPVARALEARTGDLALIGHLPHLPRLAALLLSGDADRELIDLPPAGALCLLRTDTSPPHWSLRWMLTPRLLA